MSNNTDVEIVSDAKIQKFLRRCDEICCDDEINYSEDFETKEEYKERLYHYAHSIISELNLIKNGLKILKVLTVKPERFYHLGKYFNTDNCGAFQYEVNTHIIDDLVGVVTEFRVSLSDALKHTLQNYESQKRKLEDEVKFYKANYKELFKKEYIYNLNNQKDMIL